VRNHIRECRIQRLAEIRVEFFHALILESSRADIPSESCCRCSVGPANVDRCVIQIGDLFVTRNLVQIFFIAEKRGARMEG
jgi:hypothetical protein